MSVQKIIVHTQYFENYGFHEGGEYWKPKGGYDFHIMMDLDLLMYSNHKAIFSEMLKSKSNELNRFEYIDYSVQWEEPELLGTQEDYIQVNQKLETV